MTDNHDEFEEPDEALVIRVLTRIGDIQHRRAFFAGLHNPRWLGPLDAHGMFELDRNSLGRGLLRPWPEGDYLIRMSAIAPDEVASILERHLMTDDHIVRLAIVQAAAGMPAAAAARLSDGIRSYFTSPMHIDHEVVVQLIENLFAGGETKKARRLVESLYGPRAARDTDEGPGDAPGSIDPYWYAQTVPRVVKAMVRADPRSLSGVAQWLAAYQLATGKYVEGSDHDVSDSWRPSIRAHEQNWGFDEIGDALVDVLRDVTTDQLSTDAPPKFIIERLTKSGQPIHTRIAMDALAQTLESDPAGWDRLGDIVAELILNPSHLDAPYWHETLTLARAALPNLSDDEYRLLVATVMSGPVATDEQLGEWLNWRVGESGSDGPDELSLQQEVTNYRKRWRLRLLAGIGRQHLRGELLDEFERLARELPLPDHPEFSSWHEEGWVGPTAPVSVDDLTAMADNALVEHLTTWRPESESHFGPTVDGQARVIEDAAAQSPERFANLLPQLADAPISYTRSVLRGLERALEGGLNFPWEPVLRQCLAIALRADAPGADARVADDDPVWTWAKRQVADLLRRGANEANWTAADAEVASSVLEVLADHSNPSLDREAGDGAQMDSLTLSLNTVRPAAVRGLLMMLTNDLTPDTRARIHRALDAHVGREADPSLAVSAVFGQALGQLLASDEDRDWVDGRLELLLGDPDTELNDSSAYVDTVWSVMLASYHHHPRLVERLRPWWMRAVRDLSTTRGVVEGWRGQRGQRAQLGDHLVTLVVRGQLPLDDPLVQGFFAHAEVTTRSDVIGHLGWALMRAEEVDSAFLERAKALVASRADVVGELDDFAWWPRIKQVPPEWWLPLLARAVISPTFNDRRMLSEPLAAAAGTSPGIALDVLDRLLKRRDDDQPWRRYDLIESAPAIIAAAIESGSPSLAEAAVELMDSLGREGVLDMRERVERERERLRDRRAQQQSGGPGSE